MPTDDSLEASESETRKNSARGRIFWIFPWALGFVFLGVALVALSCRQLVELRQVLRKSLPLDDLGHCGLTIRALIT